MTTEPQATPREKVFAAAQQLADAGQRPTMNAIRELIGGSYSTISPLLNEWKQRKADQEKVAPLPALVSDRLQAMGAELWTAAVTAANGAWTAERERLSGSLAEMENEREEAIRLADSLTREVAELRERVDEAVAKESVAAENARKMHEEVTRAGQEAKVAQARVDEMQRSQELLRGELDRAHAEVEKERARAAEAREAYARLAGKQEAEKPDVRGGKKR